MSKEPIESCRASVDFAARLIRKGPLTFDQFALLPERLQACQENAISRMKRHLLKSHYQDLADRIIERDRNGGCP